MSGTVTRTAAAASSAVQMLRLHRLRTSLAVIGIVVGAMALSAVLMLSNGLNTMAEAELANNGSMDIIVRPREYQTLNGLRFPRDTVVGLRPTDAQALGAALDGTAAAALVQVGALKLFAGGRDRGVAVRGVTTSGTPPALQQLYAGRVPDFSGAEKADSDVVVVTYALARLLAGDGTAPGALLGQSLVLGNRSLRVVGIEREVDRSSPYVVWMRGDIAPSILPLTERSLVIRPSGAATPRTIHATLDRVMQWRDNFRPQWRHAVVFEVPGGARVESMHRRAQLLRLTLAGFCLLTFFVAAVGIANVIFASVLERTREIGVRKAVGARRADIFGQFIAESLSTTIVGGAVGTGAGWAVASLLSWFVRSRTGQPLHVELGVEIVALSMSVAVAAGFIAGVFPAAHATRMAPADAIRTE